MVEMCIQGKEKHTNSGGRLVLWSSRELEVGNGSGQPE